MRDSLVSQQNDSNIRLIHLKKHLPFLFYVRYENLTLKLILVDKVPLLTL